MALGRRVGHRKTNESSSQIGTHKAKVRGEWDRIAVNGHHRLADADGGKKRRPLVYLRPAASRTSPVSPPSAARGFGCQSAQPRVNRRDNTQSAASKSRQQPPQAQEAVRNAGRSSTGGIFGKPGPRLRARPQPRVGGRNRWRSIDKVDSEPADHRTPQENPSPIGPATFCGDRKPRRAPAPSDGVLDNVESDALDGVSSLRAPLLARSMVSPAEPVQRTCDWPPPKARRLRSSGSPRHFCFECYSSVQGVLP
ncbi:hypothetical protein DFJ74DRAFT_122240 [Hyaloraphidium curvatum]|nr:hypothetical protein DFJ74DRAFT_122240 [Hyaloraphidium curvatum]